MKNKHKTQINQFKHLLEKRMGALQQHFSLKDTPPFPLAMNTKMPEGHEYEFGDISFRFSDFEFHQLGDIQLGDLDKESEDHDYQLELSLDKFLINGKYNVEAKNAPKIDLDTAGTMLPLNDPDQIQAAGANGSSTFTPEESEEYLNQAREQRTRLMDNKNGQKLMTTYNDHNEVYDDIFKTDANLRYHWKAGGSTAEMAKDTSKAVKENKVVNDPKKKYGKNTYNGNSFVQQNNIIASCITASGYNPWTGGSNLPDNKYTQAALASMNFQKSAATTGNTKTKVNAVTPDAAHSSVKGYDGKEPSSSLKELENRNQQISRNGGAEAIEEAKKKGWIILDEEDREHMRKMITASWMARQNHLSRIAQPLWQGDCSALIEKAKAAISFSIDESGTALQYEGVQLKMPAFEFELDDQHWEGETGELVRKRLSQVYFVRSLLSAQITSAVEEAIHLAALDAWGEA